MSQPNFPPARLFDAFAKPASTEQPAKKGLLGKLRLSESSEEDNYTTVMLVGFNSAKEPPGNGEDALDVIHRAFDPCDESPGFDMDDFYDYASVAPQLQNSDDSESTVLVAQDVLQHGHHPGAPPAPARGDRTRSQPVPAAVHDPLLQVREETPRGPRDLR